LVNRVVANDALVPEAVQWANQLNTVAPLSLKYSKFVLQQAMRMDLSDTMRLT